MPHSVLVERIYFLAKQKGISIRELQRQLGLHIGSIASWDNKSPRLSQILPISRYFDVSLDYLCGIDESHNIRNYPENTQKLFHLIYAHQYTNEQSQVILEYLQTLDTFHLNEIKEFE